MVAPAGASLLNDCVYLLRANNFGAAFNKALALGSAKQTEYRNADGNLVIWKFKEIISLDVIASDNLDGAEIYSEPIHLGAGEIIPFETEFDPRTSKPIQTI